MKTVKRPFTLALICCCLGTNYTEAQVSSLPLRQQAVVAGKTTDERIAYYSKTVSERPEDTHTRVLLALEYLQKMRETGEGKYLKLASKSVDPPVEQNNPEVMRVQNEIDLQLHQFRRVAERSRSLLAINPSDTGSLGNLGDALMELGEYEQAGEAYKKMFGLRPNLASYNRAAYFHFVTGNAPTAIALMRNAIEAGSKIPEQVAWCWSELGDMQWKTGDIRQARESYLTALKLYDPLHRAHAGLGRLLSVEGKLDEAAEQYKRAQSILPLPEYSAALETIYSLQGRKREAKNERELQDATATIASANGEKANRVLALIYVDQDRKLEEAERLVQAEFANRGDVYTYDALGWVLQKLNRLTEAEEAATKALKLGTPEPSFYAHAGIVAARLGKREQATKLLTHALELNGNFDLKLAKTAQATLAEVTKAASN